MKSDSGASEPSAPGGAVPRPSGTDRAQRSAWPKFRACRWIDTSPEAMEREQATITYGIQAQPTKGAKWMHVHSGGDALFFDSAEAASEAIDRLWSETRSAQFR